MSRNGITTIITCLQYYNSSFVLTGKDYYPANNTYVTQNVVTQRPIKTYIPYNCLFLYSYGIHEKYKCCYIIKQKFGIK